MVPKARFSTYEYNGKGRSERVILRRMEGKKWIMSEPFKGLMVHAIEYAKPISAGNVRVIYYYILRVLYREVFPRLVGYSKMAVAYSIYVKGQKKTGTYTLGPAIQCSDAGGYEKPTFREELLDLLDNKARSDNSRLASVQSNYFQVYSDKKSHMDTVYHEVLLDDEVEERVNADLSIFEKGEGAQRIHFNLIIE